jgi:hypothetical protein
MPVRRNPDAEVAMQYLTWALGEIEKTGDEVAARYTRIASERLRSLYSAHETE